jgi:hypothetical protein
MNRKKIAIVVLLILIALILAAMLLLTVPALSGYHPSIGLLGIFLVIFSIPIILYILLKRKLRIYAIVFYLIYFIFTGLINIFISIVMEEGLEIFDIDGHYAGFSIYHDAITPFLFYIFFSFQFPIIILCILTRKINRYDNDINLKYFLKNPLIYIFILSLFLSPLALFLF